jgi:hypothetical protein
MGRYDGEGAIMTKSRDKLVYTDDERAEIIAAAKSAAVAVWDVVREVEKRVGQDIDFSIQDLIADDLAPGCNMPPSHK